MPIEHREALDTLENDKPYDSIKFVLIKDTFYLADPNGGYKSHEDIAKEHGASLNKNGRPEVDFAGTVFIRGGKYYLSNIYSSVDVKPENGESTMHAYARAVLKFANEVGAENVIYHDFLKSYFEAIN